MKNPKYCIGEELELLVDYGAGDSHVKAGERFKVISFPSFATKTKASRFSYFLYGKTSDGRHCRVYVENVKRTALI